MTSAQDALPNAPFRVVTAVAVLNQDGSTKGWLTDIMPGGTVTIDTTAEVVRTCSFEILDPSGLLMPLWPSGGYLDPSKGVEVQIFSGYDVDGAVTLFSLGIFYLQEVDVASGSGGTTAPGPVLTVTANDRAERISTNLFTDAFSIAQGTSIAQAVLDVLASQAPWCTQVSIAPASATVAAQAAQPGDDPWALMQSICASGGQLIFFDRDGVLRVIDDPSANPAPPTATFADGLGNPATSVTRTTSNSPGYNGVIVTGQSMTSSSTVISGSAFDMDPSSPFYALGPYGKRPAPPVQVSTVTTSAQAAQMAQALLPQVLGMTRQVVVDCAPCFWLEAYDLTVVTNIATRTDEVLILEQATMPLDYSTLGAVTSVPLGTPISQFDGLNNQPSVAAYAPVSNGSFNYNPTTGTYTYSSTSGTTGSVGTGLSLSGIGSGGLGGVGGMGFGIFGIPGVGGGGVTRFLRTGNGGYEVKRDTADGVTTVERTVEDA